MNGHTLFITGAAGYVGAMLAQQFSKRDDVAVIVALDKEPQPELLTENSKIVWITGNTANKETWSKKVASYNPDIVIHTAWQIREMYGQQNLEWEWNVEGSERIFEFAFSTPSVKKLIYFSSAAVYGAYPSNSIEHRFSEDEPMREEEYSYGREKKQVEENLATLFKQAPGKRSLTPQVTVVRPAAITGPRGRFMRIRFGLQSALSGQLKGDVLYRIISLLVSFVPATPWWVRQFVHEDDVTDIIARLSFEEVPGSFEIFNLTPPGAPVLAPQMARAVGKRVLSVYPWMIRLAYFVFWHLTRGKVPTGRGVWRFYSYPVVMGGSKLTRKTGYTYVYQSEEAFVYTNGRYEYAVPKGQQNPKS